MGDKLSPTSGQGIGGLVPAGRVIDEDQIKSVIDNAVQEKGSGSLKRLVFQLKTNKVLNQKAEYATKLRLSVTEHAILDTNGPYKKEVVSYLLKEFGNKESLSAGAQEKVKELECETRDIQKASMPLTGIRAKTDFVRKESLYQPSAAKPKIHFWRDLVKGPMPSLRKISSRLLALFFNIGRGKKPVADIEMQPVGKSPSPLSPVTIKPKQSEFVTPTKEELESLDAARIVLMHYAKGEFVYQDPVNEGGKFHLSGFSGTDLSLLSLEEKTTLVLQMNTMRNLPLFKALTANNKGLKELFDSSYKNAVESLIGDFDSQKTEEKGKVSDSLKQLMKDKDFTSSLTGAQKTKIQEINKKLTSKPEEKIEETKQQEAVTEVAQVVEEKVTAESLLNELATIKNRADTGSDKLKILQDLHAVRSKLYARREHSGIKESLTEIKKQMREIEAPLFPECLTSIEKRAQTLSPPGSWDLPTDVQEAFDFLADSVEFIDANVGADGKIVEGANMKELMQTLGTNEGRCDRLFKLMEKKYPAIFGDQTVQDKSTKETYEKRREGALGAYSRAKQACNGSKFDFAVMTLLETGDSVAEKAYKAKEAAYKDAMK